MDHDRDHKHGHDRGLAADLPTLLDRRRALKLIAGVGLCCPPRVDRTRRGQHVDHRVVELVDHNRFADVDDNRRGCELFDHPGGDGRPLSRRRLERAERPQRERRRAQRHPVELRRATTVAEGVPLTIKLTSLDSNNGCKPLAGAAVYLWHCDIDGQLLDVLAGRHRRELPARRAGDRRSGP